MTSPFFHTKNAHLLNGKPNMTVNIYYSTVTHEVDVSFFNIDSKYIMVKLGQLEHKQ